MHKEPVTLLAALAVVIVSIAAVFNIGLETSTVETLLVNGLILVTADIQRSKVTPV